MAAWITLCHSIRSGDAAGVFHENARLVGFKNFRRFQWVRRYEARQNGRGVLLRMRFRAIHLLPQLLCRTVRDRWKAHGDGSCGISEPGDRSFRVGTVVVFARLLAKVLLSSNLL